MSSREPELEPSSNFRLTCRTAWETEKISDKFASTSWGKKLASQKRRASLNDFERFQAMVLKKRLNFQIRHPNGVKKGKK